MKLLKKIILFIALASSLLLVLPAGQALAFDTLQTACNGASGANVCGDANTTTNPIVGPNGILTKVVNLLSILIGIAAVVVIIIAGIRFALSGGDAAKVSTARNTILYAAVGLVVAAVAQGIVIFVLNRL